MRHRFTNATLADGRTVDITTDEGLITAVDPVAGGERTPGAPDSETDLAGFLVLPPLAEPHAHIDKALTAERVPNPTGDLHGAIDAWIAAHERGEIRHDDIVRHVREALDAMLLNGVTAVRSHVNCGARAGVTAVKAVLEAIEPYRPLIDIQLVALNHSPVVGSEGAVNLAALEGAVELGVDLVGGCPHFEPAAAESIAQAIDLAAEAGLGVDLHVDETLDPSMLTIRLLAAQVADRGFGGRVTASHCVSLGMQPPDVQEAIAAELAAAGIAVVALPQTNLFLQGRDHPTAPPRGLTAIHPLRAAGVVVAGGADNLQDPFNLMGRADPLETAALLVMAGHVLPDDAYEMVSNDARRAMGLAPVRFRAGDPADFVAIDAPSIRAAIAWAPVDRTVVRAGRIVAHSHSERTITR